MPAINFPDASASPWFNDPANGGNGVTYEYKNGYWTAIDVTGANAIDIGTGDQRYVQKAPAGNASQNISGNLTINTDKIQLKTDGSITAAGNVGIGTLLPTQKLDVRGNVYVGDDINADGSIISGDYNNTAGVKLWDSGYISILGSANSSLAIYQDTADVAGKKIELKADGSAEFKGRVKADTRTSGGTAVFALNTSTSIDDAPLTILNGSSAGGEGNGYLINGLGPNSDKIFSVRNDGTSTFAGAQTLASASAPASNGYTSHINNTVASTAACFTGNNHNADGIIFMGVDGSSSNAITSKVLNDGSAQFNGNITSNGITQYELPPMGGGGQLGYDNSTKSFRLYANSSTNADAKIQFHFNQSDTADITFNQGGSAEFKGDVTVKSNVLVKGGNGSGIFIRNKEDTAYTIDLNENGSAEFKGEVTTGQVRSFSPTETLRIKSSRTSGDVFTVWTSATSLANGTKVATIFADGSAEFKGRVTPSGITSDDNITGNRTLGTSACFVGQLNGSDTSYINANGSASFTSTVQASRFTNSTTSADPWLKGVNSSGIETFNVNKAGAASFAEDKIRLNFDGTAEFYRASTNTTDDLCSWSSNVGSTKAIQIRFKADGTISGKNVTFDLEADDDTKYTTTTDSEGVETRVYNGAVLNVKDRLQKADAALQSLKTAAAASTNFASLKAAIATALANI